MRATLVALVVVLCAQTLLPTSPSISLSAWVTWQLHANTSSLVLPFSLGERLSYRISWSNKIQAGSAELTVGAAGMENPGQYRLQLKASSAPEIADLYELKYESTSYFDLKSMAPLRYEENIAEKRRVINEATQFDHFSKVATYTNRKNETSKIPIQLGTQDAVSVFYVLRSLGLMPGFTVSIPVFEAGHLFQLETKAAGTELITTSLGSFQTDRLEIILRREGAPLPDKRITLWMTRDDRRLPVLASVALPVGVLLAELTAETGRDRQLSN